MNSTLASSLTPRCTGRNGTYCCQLPEGHKSLHKVTRRELDGRNELVAVKNFSWADSYSQMHVKTIRTAGK